MNRRIEARRLDEIRRQKRTALGGRSQAAIDLQQLRDGSHGLEPQLSAVRRTHREPVQRHAANVDFARAEHDALGVVQAWTRECEYRFRRLREARRGRGLQEERERAAVLIDVEGVVRDRVRADQGEPGRRRRRGLRRQRVGELEEEDEEDHGCQIYGGRDKRGCFNNGVTPAVPTRRRLRFVPNSYMTFWRISLCAPYTARYARSPARPPSWCSLRRVTTRAALHPRRPSCRKPRPRASRRPWWRISSGRSGRRRWMPRAAWPPRRHSMRPRRQAPLPQRSACRRSRPLRSSTPTTTASPTRCGLITPAASSRVPSRSTPSRARLISSTRRNWWLTTRSSGCSRTSSVSR